MSNATPPSIKTYNRNVVKALAFRTQFNNDTVDNSEKFNDTGTIYESIVRYGKTAQ